MLSSGGRKEEGGGGQSRESPSRQSASAVTAVIELPGVHVGPLVTFHIVTVIVSEVAARHLTAQNAELAGAPAKRATTEEEQFLGKEDQL